MAKEPPAQNYVAALHLGQRDIEGEGEGPNLLLIWFCTMRKWNSATP